MIRQALLAFVFASSAMAQEEPSLSTEAALAQVTTDPGCQNSDWPHLAMTMYVCDGGRTFWYFTKPEADSPPGYIHRAIFVRDGQTYIETKFHYDGTDAEQHAFDAWSARVGASILQASQSR